MDIILPICTFMVGFGVGLIWQVMRCEYHAQQENEQGDNFPVDAV